MKITIEIEPEEFARAVAESSRQSVNVVNEFSYDDWIRMPFKMQQWFIDELTRQIKPSEVS